MIADVVYKVLDAAHDGEIDDWSASTVLSVGIEVERLRLAGVEAALVGDVLSKVVTAVR